MPCSDHIYAHFAWYWARSSYLVHRSVSPSEYKRYLTRVVYVAFERRTHERRLLQRSVSLARIAPLPVGDQVFGSPFMTLLCRRLCGTQPTQHGY